MQKMTTSKSIVCIQTKKAAQTISNIKSSNSFSLTEKYIATTDESLILKAWKYKNKWHSKTENFQQEKEFATQKKKKQESCELDRIHLCFVVFSHGYVAP